MDISTRVLASKAEKFLGQPFIISNNGGGGGSVALGIVAKERPDGYYLAGCTSTGLIRIPQFRPVPYKLEDFIPIMHFGAPQTGLVVKADSPWKTLRELVEYAKKNPGKVTYSSTGVGSPMHLAMEYVAKQEGIQWTHVPYPGSTPALTALMGGHVTAQSGSTEWIPQVKAGEVRLLATHGEKRMKIFPDVPTFRELGYDFINETVFMAAAPKGTPSPIVKKLEEAFHKAMDDPEFIQTMERMEIEITYRNSEDTKKYLEEAYARLGKMIIELKIPKEPEKK
jgi:tripartite-type tricarboxylate transporter receptor subunit TctC